MKRIAVYILLTMFLITGCNIMSSPKEVTLKLLGNEYIAISKNEVLKIDLSDNPSTGYSWELIEKRNDNIVRQEDPVYSPSDQAISGMVGAGGTSTYRFKGMKEGDAYFVFEYKRQWEKDKPPARSYTLHVKVTG